MVMLVVGLVCVPALTRVHQRLQPTGATTVTAGYSRSAECPPEKIAGVAVLVRSVASTIAVVQVPLPRAVWPVRRPRVQAPFELPTDGLRAPPLV